MLAQIVHLMPTLCKQTKPQCTCLHAMLYKSIHCIAQSASACHRTRLYSYYEHVCRACGRGAQNMRQAEQQAANRQLCRYALRLACLNYNVGRRVQAASQIADKVTAGDAAGSRDHIRASSGGSKSKARDSYEGQRCRRRAPHYTCSSLRGCCRIHRRLCCGRQQRARRPRRPQLAIPIHIFNESHLRRIALPNACRRLNRGRQATAAGVGRAVDLCAAGQQSKHTNENA